MKTMNPKFKLSIVACFFLFLISSCVKDLGIEGSGVIISQYRSLQGFDGVISDGDYDVFIKQGNTNDYEIEVVADEKFVPYISTFVSNNTLTIQNMGNHYFKGSERVEIYITMPSMAYVELAGSGSITTDYAYVTSLSVNLSGSGEIKMRKLDVTNVDATISGSGNIEMDGDAKNEDLQILGKGNIYADYLYVDDCGVRIGGVGDAYVNAYYTLEVATNGSGIVYYIGHPSITGNGTVAHITH